MVITVGLHCGPHAVLWTVSGSAGLKIAIIGIDNHLNYCIIIKVCIQFENVAGAPFTTWWAMDCRPTVCPFVVTVTTVLAQAPLLRPAVNILVDFFLF